ncbi:MAG: hypothetical protein IJW49_08055 [Clostridia bacterium]|nr:hypothetical protein [Clostridia bacterium]
MPNFHKQRVAKRVIKIIFTLFIVAVNALLLWRVFFSTALPDKIEDLEPNAPLAAAYLQHGDQLQVRYQNNFTTTYGTENAGYFSNAEAVFITEANQVQVVIRYPNSTLENLQKDYALPEKPDKALDWFDFSLVKTTDLTPSIKEDNLDESTLSFQRILPTTVTRDESSLYTFYRLTFDGVTVEELTAEEKQIIADGGEVKTNHTIGIFLDVFYLGDVNYDAKPYGTLCIYDCEMPWETRALSGDEKESFVNFPIS